MTAGWSPDCSCPECGRTPNVGFSPDEVRRAKRERQGARVMSVQCPKCKAHWWIFARDIANAKPPTLLLLLDPGTAAALRRAGLTTEDEIRARLQAGTLADVKGISSRREHEIRVALDSAPRAVVA